MMWLVFHISLGIVSICTVLLCGNNRQVVQDVFKRPSE